MFKYVINLTKIKYGYTPKYLRIVRGFYIWTVPTQYFYKKHFLINIVGSLNNRVALKINYTGGLYKYIPFRWRQLYFHLYITSQRLFFHNLLYIFSFYVGLLRKGNYDGILYLTGVNYFLLYNFENIVLYLRNSGFFSYPGFYICTHPNFFSKTFGGLGRIKSLKKFKRKNFQRKLLGNMNAIYWKY